LIEADAEMAVTAATSKGKSKRLSESEVSDVFGIEFDAAVGNALPDTSRKREPASTKVPAKPRKVRKPSKKPGKSAAKKKTVAKITVARKGKAKAKAISEHASPVPMG
jgi:hypothetical protein